MNLKTGIITGLSAILLMFTSCEDFIDVDQPDIIEQEQAFDDNNSTRLALIGLYGLMTELVEPMFLAGEVRADLVISTKSADAFISEFSNNSFSASNPYISPKPFYAIINNANDFLTVFEEKVANHEMDSIDFSKYKSELVAIRVWTQYQIAKIFGECKYYTNVLTPENSTNLETLPYGDELLERLISDIKYSDTVSFTIKEESVIWNTVRFSDYYVNNIMAEIYLDLGDYENALDKFAEITNLGDSISIETDRFNIKNFLYERNWMDELFSDNWESSQLIDNAVFVIGFDSKYNQRNELSNWTKSLNYQVAPATWYYDYFNEYAYTDLEQIDYRVNSLEDGNDNIGLSNYYINKYVENDRPLIMTRTARIELQKAYCVNKIYGARIAFSYINLCRTRINAPKIVPDLTAFVDDSTALIWLEDKIIDELAFETGFEGQRWFDLMRVAKSRNDPSYLADRVAQKYTSSSKDEIHAKLMDPSNWFIPLFE